MSILIPRVCYLCEGTARGSALPTVIICFLCDVYLLGVKKRWFRTTLKSPLFALCGFKGSGNLSITALVECLMEKIVLLVGFALA